MKGLLIETPETEEEIIIAYLRYLESTETELLPTQRNAERFAADVLIPAWRRGEPILLARLNGRVIGATFTTLPGNRYEFRTRYATGHGTWVHPDYRRSGVASRLLKAVRNMLKGAKVTMQLGMAHTTNETSLVAFQKRGFVPHGIVLRAEI